MKKQKSPANTVSVRIPEYLHTELVEISQREGESIVSMLETAISDYLENREDVARFEVRWNGGQKDSI